MTDNAAVFKPLTNAEASAGPNVQAEPLNDWVPIMPVPEEVTWTEPPHKLGRPSKIWPYVNGAGQLLGAIARFETPDGKTTRPLTYCEKNGRREWRWKSFPVPRSLYALDYLAQNPSAPVLVVEGEKAADAAQALLPEHAVTTSPGGARAPSTACWDHLEGRVVTIWPDHDTDGLKYADDVARLALEAGTVSVAIVNVPDTFPEKWDLAEPIPDGWDFDSIKGLLKSAGQVTKAITLDIGSDIEIARRVGKSLAAQYGQIIVSEGAVWRYVDTHWERFSDSELRRIVHRYDGATFGDHSIVKLGRARVDSILNEFIAMQDAQDFFIEAPDGINCLSGFIKFPEDGSDLVLEKHAPEHRCRHVIQGRWPVDSTDEAWSSSLLAHLLRGCFKGDPDAADKVNLLGEVAGAAVLGKGTRHLRPKAIVLKGDTAENGKSQILDVIRGLLPPNAVSALPLGKMGDDRFVCGLIGKLLNASDELTSAAAVASDAFKQVITGEPITARDVYSSAVTFRSIAQHLYATNDLPSFKGGMDRGVQRRLLVLTFNRTIPVNERIEHIGDRIATEETDLLLEWAVNGAQRLLKQRYFTEPQSSKEALKDWLYGADPVLAWLDQVAVLDSKAQIQPRHAYTAFKEWALAEGYRENVLPAISTFSHRIQASGKGITSKRTSSERLLIGLAVSSDEVR